jgi:hypothetical protein
LKLSQSRRIRFVRNIKPKSWTFRFATVNPILVVGTKAVRGLFAEHSFLEPASVRLPGAPLGGKVNFNLITLRSRLLGADNGRLVPL